MKHLHSYPFSKESYYFKVRWMWSLFTSASTWCCCQPLPTATYMKPYIHQICVCRGDRVLCITNFKIWNCDKIKQPLLKAVENKNLSSKSNLPFAGSLRWHKREFSQEYFRHKLACHLCKPKVKCRLQKQLEKTMKVLRAKRNELGVAEGSRERA